MQREQREQCSPQSPGVDDKYWSQITQSRFSNGKYRKTRKIFFSHLSEIEPDMKSSVPAPAVLILFLPQKSNKVFPTSSVGQVQPVLPQVCLK